MTQLLNSFGQPVGPPVENWTARPLPPLTPMEGRYCRLEKLDPGKHAAALYAEYAKAPDGRDWTYLPRRAVETMEDYAAWARDNAVLNDPLHFTVLVDGIPLGTLAHMRIDPANGVIEVGGIMYAPALQRTRAATEAVYLMMRRAFDELGYRRHEWKCDALHAGSRAAAARFGFRFEGIFRQAVVTKGRSRDTAWYAVTDQEWPTLRGAFEQWLSPDNFDQHGRQRRALASFR